MNILDKIVADISSANWRVVDGKKLASYLQEEREAREALEKRVHGIIDGMDKIYSRMADLEWIKPEHTTPSIDKECDHDWMPDPLKFRHYECLTCGESNPDKTESKKWSGINPLKQEQIKKLNALGFDDLARKVNEITERFNEEREAREALELKIESIKAILMDIAAEQGSRDISGEKWFNEVSQAIRAITDPTPSIDDDDTEDEDELESSDDSIFMKNKPTQECTPSIDKVKCKVHGEYYWEHCPDCIEVLKNKINPDKTEHYLKDDEWYIEMPGEKESQDIMRETVLGEDWEEKFADFYYKETNTTAELDNLKQFVRETLKADRKKTIEFIESLPRIACCGGNKFSPYAIDRNKLLKKLKSND